MNSVGKLEDYLCQICFSCDHSIIRVLIKYAVNFSYYSSELELGQVSAGDSDSQDLTVPRLLRPNPAFSIEVGNMF